MIEKNETYCFMCEDATEHTRSKEDNLMVLYKCEKCGFGKWFKKTDLKEVVANE